MSLRAKKSLGQNFLNAPGVIRTMINTAKINEGDVIVEIGPGKGVLTQALLEQGAQVIAYELDTRMITYLNETFSSYCESGQLTIIHKDILEVDHHTHQSFGAYKVVANIPYYITNPIIRLFLSSPYQPESLCLIVQKEVAFRIARDPHESILSLSVKVYGTPHYITKVPARYFSPQPKVDSAVLYIDNISKQRVPSLEHEESFFTLVRAGFAHKRKKLISNLASLEGTDKRFWEYLFTRNNLSPNTRAEAILLDTWLVLAQEYHRHLVRMYN
jgi:16S rRNA (adenine1518-N6/adenine1519-N6)-dimethyltransferase